MRRRLLIVILCGMSVTAFAAERQTRAATDRPAPPAKVLLAYEETPFKNGLVQEMKSRLRKRGLKVELVDHGQGGLAGRNASDYDAVFLSASGVNSMVRPWLVAWLSTNAAFADRVLLHVTRTRDWTVEAPVDVVTSASAPRETATLASNYTAILLRKAAGRR